MKEQSFEKKTNESQIFDFVRDLQEFQVNRVFLKGMVIHVYLFNSRGGDLFVDANASYDGGEGYETVAMLNLYQFRTWGENRKNLDLFKETVNEFLGSKN